MLKNAFFNVYTKFKLHFYQEIFQAAFQDREASLTDCGNLLHGNHPGSWAALLSTSLPPSCASPLPTPPTRSTAWSKKGYIRKVQSPDDRREYHLEVTQKYIDYYNISTSYMVQVMDRIANRFSPEECAKLEEMLTVVSRELMPEVDIPEANIPES